MFLTFIYIAKVAIAMGLKFSLVHNISKVSDNLKKQVKKKFKQDSSLTELGDVGFYPLFVGSLPALP